jgi:hypothetical protein
MRWFHLGSFQNATIKQGIWLNVGDFDYLFYLELRERETGIHQTDAFVHYKTQGERL